VSLFGSNVTDWADQSGNARDLAQATDSKRPTFNAGVLNGEAAIRFDGIDDFMTRAGVDLAQPNTLYRVMRLITDADGQFFHDGADSTKRHVAFTNNGFFAFFAGSSITSTKAKDTLTHYSGGVYNGASSELFIDGVSVATGDINTQVFSFGTLGALHDGSANFTNMDLFEWFGYSGVHDAATRAQVFDYLTARYAL